ncbi:Aste57867_7918 [Aphanomyces stellatus]|uniref:Aste57867_7918 protein n=1 Tax=Aphanomyces stellatus TaxID=120398 RepID=A0A485KIZ5_9STRA|nr:hypothetical protein As57867_007888 [Aphanomyces stellatus]VFT84811.1 Aste57867_7918 [Aphanomyces stellatus]
MRHIFLHHVFFAILAGTATATAHLDIVSGTEATVGKSLYLVSIHSGTVVDGPKTRLCSGMLITPTVVLTAAHCLARWPLVAAIGSHFTSGTVGGERIAARLATRHPAYNSSTNDFDVGVLELTRPRRIRPVNISRALDIPVGTSATARGFGKTNATLGTDATVLMETTTQIQSPAHCGMNNATSKTVLCVDGKQGVVCGGDSGGPLTILDANNVELLIGITSWGSLGCNSYTGSARVAAARSFIQGFFNAADYNLPPLPLARQNG